MIKKVYSNVNNCKLDSLFDIMTGKASTIFHISSDEVLYVAAMNCKTKEDIKKVIDLGYVYFYGGEERHLSKVGFAEFIISMIELRNRRVFRSH